MSTIGIDLGTTTSVVAFIENGNPRSIPLDSGKTTLPSVVNYDNGKSVVGREALLKNDIDNTVFSVKRFMGEKKKICDRRPEEISADILSFIKNAAEFQLNSQIHEAVITVPAHFSESQRVATKNAASLAGIKVLRLINEPTAAAYAFGLANKMNGIFAVYDFGGGTFDFSVLRLSNGIFQVLATGGDNYLGGDDIDKRILEYNFELHGLDISKASSEKKLATLIVKSMKEEIGTKKEIYKNFIYKNNDYKFYLSSDLLKKSSATYLDKTLQIADQVLKDAGVSISKINGIVLVGGMTKMPIVKEYVQNHFNVDIFDHINPEEAVAFGAALYADSIVSEKSNTILIDVVPLTLGIETIGGGIDKIIHRNTPIPIKKEREYTTYQNNQTGIKFHLVQGERTLAKDCRSIGNFELSGIPPMSAGAARIIVEFSVDINGLLCVKAYEKNTGKTNSVVIEPSCGLTDDEMISMLENAIKHKEEDFAEATYINLRIDSERQINFWEDLLNDIPNNDRKIVANERKSLKESLSKKNYQESIIHKKNIENIVAKYLDDIIKDKLSKSSLITKKIIKEKK